MHPALFYRPGERLSLSELSAARLDGHVIEVGDGYMPADTVEGRDARATSLADLVSDRVAACGPTAAWIHGAGDLPPGLHHVRRTSPSRFRPELPPRVIYHESRVPPEDVQHIAGVAVTAPLPTAVELLFHAALRSTGRGSTDEDGAAEKWLHALLLVEPGLADATHHHVVQMPRRPGRRIALRLLQEIVASQDVVTR